MKYDSHDYATGEAKYGVLIQQKVRNFNTTRTQWLYNQIGDDISFSWRLNYTFAI